MAATAEQIALVRRMAGITINDPVYSPDSVVAAYITRYSLIDAHGRAPGATDWVATYDLHAAAADILEERAAALAVEFDFSADGASYQRSQQYEKLMQQCRFYRARRTPTSITQVKWPKERTMDMPWIGNLPEPR